MLDELFERDDAKAATNWRDHGVTFEMARNVFNGIFAVEAVDDGQGAHQPRDAALRMVDNPMLFVAYTMIGKRSTSFQPAMQNLMSEGDTMTKTARHDWSNADTMSDAERHAAALKDPHAQPLAEDSLAGMRLVPRTRTTRRALGLTQEAFAMRYHIPLGTLRDWEQGRSEPDQTARAYLTVIAHERENVSRAFAPDANYST